MATVSIRSVSGAMPVAEWIEGRLGHIVNAHRDALDAVVLDRVVVDATPDQFDQFVDGVDRGQPGGRLLARWRRWIVCAAILERSRCPSHVQRVGSQPPIYE